MSIYTIDKDTNYDSFFNNDQLLIKTISNVCKSHGLNNYQLDDREFPLNETIGRDQVNVRLLCLLLRVGDLLDLSNKRACPYVMEFIKPIPGESVAHWNLTKRIIHKSITPNSLEFTLECETIEEHRLAKNWFKWLDNEIGSIKKLIPKSCRHGTWNPPQIKTEGDNPTINVVPSVLAKYIPYDWKIYFDNERIIKSLGEHLYNNKFLVIRELVQNSIDALKCKLCEDVPNIDEKIHENNFFAVDEIIRNKYFIEIVISDAEILNPVLGENETFQVIHFSDKGIGMDVNVIKNHFLQIGSSYYTTEEFRSKYAFQPTNNFGYGFLSVFNLSDNIEVNTLKENNQSEPLNIKIIGISDYLLIEKSERKTPGTDIKLILNKGIIFEKGEIVEFVREICRNLEFNVLINEYGQQTIIENNFDKIESGSIEPLSGQGNKYILEKYPLKNPYIFGSIYIIFDFIDDKKILSSNYVISSLKSNPNYRIPHNLDDCVCFNGISYEFQRRYRYKSNENIFYQLDVRDNKLVNFNIPRYSNYHAFKNVWKTVHEQVFDIIEETLKDYSLKSDFDEFEIKQRIINRLEDIVELDDLGSRQFDLAESFYYYENNSIKKTSFSKFLLNVEYFKFITPNLSSEARRSETYSLPYYGGGKSEYQADLDRDRNALIKDINQSPVISDTYYYRLSEIFSKYLFYFYEPILVYENMKRGFFVINFIRNSKVNFHDFHVRNHEIPRYPQHHIYVDFKKSDLIGIELNNSSISYRFVLINNNNSTVKKIKELIEFLRTEEIPFNLEKIKNIEEALIDMYN